MADGDNSGAGDLPPEPLDFQTLLSSPARDFLVRNNGDQVKINTLRGKIVGLYFSGSWCPHCRCLTPILVEVYQDLASKGDFEVVFISCDQDEESFDGYFSEMPWLAVPYLDLETRKGLMDLFKVWEIPYFVVIDENGKVSTDQGTDFVLGYGVEGYPFTAERIGFLKEQEEVAKKDQSLSSLLVSSSRDYLFKGYERVNVSELEGKMVGLYFTHGLCSSFTQKLVNFYKTLKQQGRDFEIVSIPLDFEIQYYKERIEVPWLSLPFKDKRNFRLARYFELKTVPTLVIIGQDGKTLHPNVFELIDEHGIEAYPFSAEKIAELAAKLEAQTLKSLLVIKDLNFVIDTSGTKVPVSELVGKHILLYFSAKWCHPCDSFLPKLITTYHEIKAKDNAFEIIFISSDCNQYQFDAFFSRMPWLALPFGDGRRIFVLRKFKIKRIPAVVAISPTGKTLNTTARQLITAHGADAFPFTDEHLKMLEEKIEQEAKGWLEKVKSEDDEKVKSEDDEKVKSEDDDVYIQNLERSLTLPIKYRKMTSLPPQIFTLSLTLPNVCKYSLSGDK